MDLSNDLHSINFTQNLTSRKEQIVDWFKEIESNLDKFPKRIKAEIKTIDILNEIAPKFKTRTLENTINKFLSLKEKISHDSWVTISLNTENESVLIKSIQEIIQSKEKYFSSEDDRFSIEFKWLQFYNSISKLEKIIIDQLLEKANWKKVFLLYYLNLMLI